MKFIAIRNVFTSVAAMLAIQIYSAPYSHAQAPADIRIAFNNSQNEERQSTDFENTDGQTASVIGSCNCCRCYPCKCPLPEAACIDCPHISTLSPNYNINIFGAVVGDMLFNESRPISPGAPYFLTSASPTGQDQNTVDIHGRSSYLAAALTGPQMGNFQAGGQAMVFFYNDNVLADQYGILPAQIWGDLKNEDWRFAANYYIFKPAPRSSALQ